jgi:solute carrier family 25 phosphate transporter 3
MYYIKGAAAGGICCSITHGALTPVDVVKTRVQLDSAKVRQSQTTTKSNNNKVKQ